MDGLLRKEAGGQHGWKAASKGRLTEIGNKGMLGGEGLL